MDPRPGGGVFQSPCAGGVSRGGGPLYFLAGPGTVLQDGAAENSRITDGGGEEAGNEIRHSRVPRRDSARRYTAARIARRAGGEVHQRAKSRIKAGGHFVARFCRDTLSPKTRQPYNHAGRFQVSAGCLSTYTSGLLDGP